ncbi:MAG: CcmD family protein [Flavobacteriales bacterium]|jgi:hypothetical protein
MIKKLGFLFLFTMLSLTSLAESNLEEYFYQSGKIKVVIAVAAIVLSGLLTFIFLLDRRVKKLEQKHKAE